MSPRAKKPRTCSCPIPKGRAFKPSGIPMHDLQSIELFADELEALKLCDRNGLTQEEAGIQMGVSRGTVQRILSSARGKVADALTNCKAITMADSVCSDTSETDS